MCVGARVRAVSRAGRALAVGRVSRGGGSVPAFFRRIPRAAPDRLEGTFFRKTPARKKLEEIEKTTGQPKSLLAGGGALFGLFLVFFLCPPQLVFSAVGVGYPTYASLKMLAEDKTEDAAMWITYWCLFSLLKVVMNPLDFILGFLPFYFYLKLVLLVWLFSPTTKGAGVVYEKVVKPFVFPLLVGSKSD